MVTNRYSRKTITYGDKIFARITRNGKTIYNYVTETVGSLTEVLMDLRKLMKGMKGLVMVHIRNYNRGWGEERPLMLYASSYENSRDNFNPSSTSNYQKKSMPKGGMLFPWQTH